MKKMLELSDKVFKAAIIRILQKAITKTLETNKRQKRSYRRKWNYKEKPNENCKIEKNTVMKRNTHWMYLTIKWKEQKRKLVN